MKTRKALLSTTTVLSLGFLAACGNAAGPHNGSSLSASKQRTAQSSSSQTSNAQPSHQERWTHQQDQQLAAFINDWAPQMHQSYQKYDGTNPLKTSVGLSYPAALSQEEVNGQTGVLGWTPNGEGNNEYNVVAIYNCDGTEPPLPNRITYFFCFHDGKPVVLVDQSRDGAPNAHLTNNQEVRSNFARMAAEH